MANNKHLTADNRCTIQTMLNDKASFKAIADALDKDRPPFQKKFALILYFEKLAAYTFITIPVPFASPAPRVTSALPVMPHVITSFADDVTCAIPSVRIFKRKFVQNF